MTTEVGRHVFRNTRARDNALVCPDCNKTINRHQGVKFRDGYALHIPCTTTTVIAEAPIPQRQ